MKIKDLIPPVVQNILNSFILFNIKIAGNFKDFQEASNICKGYEDEELIDVVYEKTKLLKAKEISDVPLQIDSSIAFNLMSFLHLCKKETINVIDFGGAFGQYYFLLRPLLDSEIKINWGVVETKAMVNRSSFFKSKELSFFSDLNEAKESFKNIDIILINATLHYLPEPYKTLEDLVNLNSTYLSILRTPLVNESQDVFAIQHSKTAINGPGPLPKGFKNKVVKYPITFLQKQRIENILQKKYTIKLFFNDKNYFTYKLKRIYTMGLLSKLKK